MDETDNLTGHTIGCFDDDAGRDMLSRFEKLSSDLNTMSDEFGSSSAKSTEMKCSSVFFTDLSKFYS
jgi:hypothetical protein